MVGDPLGEDVLGRQPGERSEADPVIVSKLAHGERVGVLDVDAVERVVAAGRPALLAQERGVLGQGDHADARDPEGGVVRGKVLPGDHHDLPRRHLVEGVRRIARRDRGLGRGLSGRGDVDRLTRDMPDAELPGHLLDPPDPGPHVVREARPGRPAPPLGEGDVPHGGHVLRVGVGLEMVGGDDHVPDGHFRVTVGPDGVAPGGVFDPVGRHGKGVARGGLGGDGAGDRHEGHDRAGQQRRGPPPRPAGHAGPSRHRTATREPAQPRDTGGAPPRAPP